MNQPIDGTEPMDEQERWQRLADLGETIQDEYGDGHFVGGDELEAVGRIPSGGILLDSALGGGWPQGRFNYLWGGESTGKTTLCAHLIKWAQRKCADCATMILPQILAPPGWERVGHWTWREVDEPDEDPGEWREGRRLCGACGAPHHVVDRPPPKAADHFDDVPEGVDRAAFVCGECSAVGEIVEPGDTDYRWHPYAWGDAACECGKCVPTVALWSDFEYKVDRDWLDSIGVDMGRLKYQVPEYAEQGLDVGLEAIRQGAVDVWVIDSLDNIQPYKQMSQSFQESDFGTGSAQLLNKFFRQLPGVQFQARNDHGTCATVVGINHVHEEVGGFHTGHVTYGGKNQDHAPAARVKLTTSDDEVESESIQNDKRKERMGLSTEVLIKGRCDKNQTAPTEGREFSVRIAKADGGRRHPGKIEDHGLCWKYGRKSGVLNKTGGEWRLDGWPVPYDKQGTFKRAMHDHWPLKIKLHRASIRRMLEEWHEIKKDL